ncbi:MAG: hypothetical protein Q8P67_17955, partial [archaeon]|nr:hypothetical protein [archaeon]
MTLSSHPREVVQVVKKEGKILLIINKNENKTKINFLLKQNARRFEKKQKEKMPDVVQSVPQYGVSLAVLEKLAALGRELAEREGRAIALTTAEISELVVKPMTRDRGCSLAELLEADDGALLREWRGKAGEATVFVSHAWRYRFDEVVETAGAFSRARAEAPAKKKIAQEGA